MKSPGAFTALLKINLEKTRKDRKLLNYITHWQIAAFVTKKLQMEPHAADFVARYARRGRTKRDVYENVVYAAKRWQSIYRQNKGLEDSPIFASSTCVDNKTKDQSQNPEAPGSSSVSPASLKNRLLPFISLDKVSDNGSRVDVNQQDANVVTPPDPLMSTPVAAAAESKSNSEVLSMVSVQNPPELNENKSTNSQSDNLSHSDHILPDLKESHDHGTSNGAVAQQPIPVVIVASHDSPSEISYSSAHVVLSQDSAVSALSGLSDLAKNSAVSAFSGLATSTGTTPQMLSVPQSNFQRRPSATMTDVADFPVGGNVSTATFTIVFYWLFYAGHTI